MSNLPTELDCVARSLAANAGIIWDSLNDYPGYTKNYWRGQARTLLYAIVARAEVRAAAAAERG